MNTAPNITAVILAGGQGLRMHGADKGLLQFHGRPLVEHVLAALQPQVSQILISANRNLVRYRHYGCPVVRDLGSAAEGPLAGVLAALQQATGAYLLTIPCDAPYLSPDYADRMYSAARARTTPAAVAHDGVRLQPVFALLARTLLEPLQGFLDRGERRARDFLLEQSALPVDFSDRRTMFVNLNRPDDLRVRAAARVAS